MITYNKLANGPKRCPDAYSVVYENGVEIGTLEQEVDGFYYFFPIIKQGFWASQHLKEIATKLDALNKDWYERITKEIGEFTPNTPPKK